MVCFDESPTQLIGEVRQPIPAAPGQPRRYDYEYRRNGTVNLFVFFDAHRPWRKVKVTEQRTAREFAECMRDLVDAHYPQADLVRVVMDNLSTHTAGALYEAFPAPEAHRILRRLEFHYTPKHASRLNMVEIEIGVLRGQCLDRRIGECKQLVLRDSRLGETAQQSQGSHKVDVHRGARAHQIGARLSNPNEGVIIAVAKVLVDPRLRIASRLGQKSDQRRIGRSVVANSSFPEVLCPAANGPSSGVPDRRPPPTWSAIH